MRYLIATVLTTLLCLSIAPSYAAESMENRCVLVVKNCLREEQGYVNRVEVFNGNDTSHFSPASNQGQMTHGQLVELSCNYKNCDIEISFIKEGPGWAPAQRAQDIDIYDRCSDIKLFWDSANSQATWTDTLSACG